MPGIACINDGRGCSKLAVVERETTPESVMKLGIRLHAAGFSLPETTSVLAGLDIEHVRSTIHKWVQKADVEPNSGTNPKHVARNETVSQLNNRRYWLYAAVDFNPTEFLHVRFFPTRNIALTKSFLANLHEKHHVETTGFLIDGVP